MEASSPALNDTAPTIQYCLSCRRAKARYKDPDPNCVCRTAPEKVRTTISCINCRKRNVLCTGPPIYGFPCQLCEESGEECKWREARPRSENKGKAREEPMMEKIGRDLVCELNFDNWAVEMRN